MADNRLGALLVDGGFIDEMQLERCLRIQAATGRTKPLGQILVEQRVIDANTLQRVIALQNHRIELAAVGDLAVDTQGQELLRAAAANRASELVVSEGRPARIRVAGSWRELTRSAMAGPEAWDFLREVMGPTVLDELAERLCVTRHGEVAGRQITATAFRQIDGVAVRVMFLGAGQGDGGPEGIPESLVQRAAAGSGLVLLVPDRSEPRTLPVRPLLAAALSAAGRHGVALFDEPLAIGPAPGLLTQRRYGLEPKVRAEAVRSALRTEPEVMAIADVGTPEVFALALGAAASGTLVIGCIDANNAVGALQRILDFYPVHEVPAVRATLADTLRGVLVRRLLPDLQRASTVVATELLLVDGPIGEVLRSGELGDLGLLMRATDGRCGWPLDHSLLSLWTTGRTSIEDVFVRAEEKAWLLARSREQAAAQSGVES